jgi:hypothetical protein
VPDMRFNRRIGAYADQHWTVDGRQLDAGEWTAYAPSVLPTPDDERLLAELFKNPDWIAPKGAASAHAPRWATEER